MSGAASYQIVPQLLVQRRAIEAVGVAEMFGSVVEALLCKAHNAQAAVQHGYSGRELDGCFVVG